MKNKKGFIIYLLLSLILWQLMDSLSKILLKTGIEENPVFSITSAKNTGIAFGFLGNNPFILGILGIISIIIISFYVYKKLSFEKKKEIIILSLFTGGILGNTAERLFSGTVLDFIKLEFINFPVFNLYDVLICSAVFLYVIFFVKDDKPNADR